VNLFIEKKGIISGVGKGFFRDNTTRNSSFSNLRPHALFQLPSSLVLQALEKRGWIKNGLVKNDEWDIQSYSDYGPYRFKIH